MSKIKPSANKKIFDIILLVFAFITHILVVAFVFMCKNYYGISKKVMISLLGIVIVFLLLVDFLMIMVFNHKDKLARVIATILVTIMVLCSTAGIIVIGKLNYEVNKVLDNTGVEQYEKVYVSFVSYDEKYDDIKDIKNKNVGCIYDSGTGTGSLGKEYLEENEINVKLETYSSQDDLFFALIDGDIEVAILPSAYQQKYANDSNIDYTEQLEKCFTIFSFEKEIKVGENNSSNKDLTIEPFNILLIGYAPENDNFGLSDTIILASINPQTLTVGLTSIARDSYVPITCYGNSSDKINAARGVSRQCLMDTVSQLLDTEIDFYVEVNFKGVVDIVDAVDGVLIYSETAFTGQSSDTERGHYNIQIPEGWHNANGEEALAFARERHAFADGDFARQRHQKQVIIAIAEKVLNVRSLDTIMNVMEAAGNNLSTNLSLEQITSLFSYLMSVDTNQYGLSIMDLIKIVDMRVTGYASWHYNEKVHLPLWIYKLYNGSIEETKENIQTILEENATINQWERFDYYLWYPYYFPSYYSESFNEAEIHEQMPAYYPYLTKMDYADVVAWAKANGVKLNVVEISTDGYSQSLWGTIISQSVSYGQLVSENPTVTITVVGTVGEKVPDFVDDYIDVAIKWAKEKNLTITTEVVGADSSLYMKEKAGKVISQTPEANSALSDSITTITLKYYDYLTINATSTFVNNADTNTLEAAKKWISSNMRYPDTVVYKAVASDDSSLYSVNRIKAASFGTNNIGQSNAQNLVITYYVKAQNCTISLETNNSSYGSISGAGSYSNTGTATVTATPNEGYKFIGWYEGSTLISPEAKYTFNVEKDVTYKAVFEAKVQITITASGTNGSVTPSSISSYSGDQVTLTATPNAGYAFVKWSDGNTSNPRIVAPTENVTYTAEFAKTYTITVTNGSGSGTYFENASVNIVADTIEGKNFVQWNDGDTNSSRAVTVTGDATYEAQYE